MITKITWKHGVEGNRLTKIDKSGAKKILSCNWFRQAISVPADLNLKSATSYLSAQSPRVDHNRDRVPDWRPHIASGRSNSIDWK